MSQNGDDMGSRNGLVEALNITLCAKVVTPSLGVL
jgi:hypothetical protein